MHGLRRLGRKGTQLARAQATTIGLRPLKIGAQIRITARQVWLGRRAEAPMGRAVTLGRPDCCPTYAALAQAEFHRTG